MLPNRPHIHTHMHICTRPTCARHTALPLPSTAEWPVEFCEFMRPCSRNERAAVSGFGGLVLLFRAVLARLRPSKAQKDRSAYLGWRAVVCAAAEGDQEMSLRAATEFKRLEAPASPMSCGMWGSAHLGGAARMRVASDYNPRSKLRLCSTSPLRDLDRLGAMGIMDSDQKPMRRQRQCLRGPKSKNIPPLPCLFLLCKSWEKSQSRQAACILFLCMLRMSPTNRWRAVARCIGKQCQSRDPSRRARATPPGHSQGQACQGMNASGRTRRPEA